ncbi:hypothetical protein HRbin32_00896 [bacterium HR32]|jgi:uncharacterized membrane protein (UPF0127 family)|nr:hypothetical protein HRbin32_00896 [bacterium HR32]
MRAAFLLAALLVWAVHSPAAAGLPRGVVTLVDGDRRVTLTVEVADTVETRARGLMYRTHLPEYAGMLFVFEAPARLAFWMKNTRIPLSIAFVDPRWRIVDIQDMDPPPPEGDVPVYLSRQEAQYALEVNQGFFRRHGIGVGAQVVFRPGGSFRGP